MTTPIEALLKTVQWEYAPPSEHPRDATPYATHEGVLHIGDFPMRCYRLNNGQTVFNADDLEAFFAALAQEAKP